MDEYFLDAYTLDRERTERAVAEWRAEALRRARQDAWVRLSGRSFLGVEKDPNAAFVVGVMQKYFLTLAREPAAVIRRFPYISPHERHVLGVVSLREGELSREGLEALLILRRISDDCSDRAEADGSRRYRFALYDVWARCELRGRAYEQWLQMTYGEQ